MLLVRSHTSSCWLLTRMYHNVCIYRTLSDKMSCISVCSVHSCLSVIDVCVLNTGIHTRTGIHTATIYSHTYEQSWTANTSLSIIGFSAQISRMFFSHHAGNLLSAFYVVNGTWCHGLKLKQIQRIERMKCHLFIYFPMHFQHLWSWLQQFLLHVLDNLSYRLLRAVIWRSNVNWMWWQKGCHHMMWLQYIYIYEFYWGFKVYWNDKSFRLQWIKCIESFVN